MLTDQVPSRTVRNSMQQSHHTARVPDSLLPPNHRLLLACAFVLIDGIVFCHAVAFIGSAYREDEEQGERRSWDECEQVWIGEGVDIVELEGWRDAELVDEVGHKLGVGLERDEGGSALLGIWVCGGRHCIRFAWLDSDGESGRRSLVGA